MSVFSCTPEDWSPFSDPSVDVDSVTFEMVERAKADPNLTHTPNDHESSLMTMKNFLKAGKNNPETAYELWKEWLEWRRG